VKIREKNKVDLHKRESLGIPPRKVLNNRAPRWINMTDRKRTQSERDREIRKGKRECAKKEKRNERTPLNHA